MQTVFVINRYGMGQGDETLGDLLMGAFLKKIWAKRDKPDMIILYNGGVKLLNQQSAYLDALHGLEESGVEIAACGTCLDHYKIKDLPVGRKSNMAEIVDIMMTADKTITI